MSAISGIFHRDGKNVTQDQINRMNNRLSHRGPDGSNIWFEGPVAFGHQMLHTTPESFRERLPFFDENSNLIITSNSRIDNRKELSPIIDLENGVEIPDSAFILRAYEIWGEKCAEKLLGDFSFAIWDCQNELLFCARDHMGVKPFYYHLNKNEFYFSTEIKAVLTQMRKYITLNKSKIGSFLVPFFDKNDTFFEQIFRLPAGCCLTVTSEKYKLKKYWTLNEKKIFLKSDDEYITIFREIFKKAVECRLRSAFPVGSFLSGGLDSSSVVCMARNINLQQNKKTVNKLSFTENRLNTYSAVFPEINECDESEFILEILNLGGLESHFIHADSINPLDNYKNIFKHTDQAVFAPNLFIPFNLCKKAQNNGIRIMLSGGGGDTVISGFNGVLAHLASTFQWKKLIKEFKETSKIRKTSDRTISTDLRLLGGIIWEILSYDFEKLEKISNKNEPWLGYPIINKEFMEKNDLKNLVKNHDKHFNARSINPRNKHLNSLTNGSREFGLETMDQVIAMCQMELSYPFYDVRLVEFSLGIPTEQKWKDGWNKLTLRKAMDGILPPKIQWRRDKSDLSPNFNQNLLKFENKIIDQFLSENYKLIEDYVDIAAFKKIYKEYKSGKLENSLLIYMVISLTLFLKNFHHFLADAE